MMAIVTDQSFWQIKFWSSHWFRSGTRCGRSSGRESFTSDTVFTDVIEQLGYKAVKSLDYKFENSSF